MAYDPSNPTDVAALKAEVFNNPGHYGSPEDTNTILEKLNDPAQARTAATGVPRLTLGMLWNIVADDSATATQFEFNISNLFAMASQEGPFTDVSEYREKIRTGAGLGDIQVRNAIDALTRDLNMAEQLFAGVDANGSTEIVTIGRNEWIAARDS